MNTPIATTASAEKLRNAVVALEVATSNLLGVRSQMEASRVAERDAAKRVADAQRLVSDLVVALMQQCAPPGGYWQPGSTPDTDGDREPKTDDKMTGSSFPKTPDSPGEWLLTYGPGRTETLLVERDCFNHELVVSDPIFGVKSVSFIHAQFPGCRWQKVQP